MKLILAKPKQKGNVIYGIQMKSVVIKVELKHFYKHASHQMAICY